MLIFLKWLRPVQDGGKDYLMIMKVDCDAAADNGNDDDRADVTTIITTTVVGISNYLAYEESA